MATTTNDEKALCTEKTLNVIKYLMFLKEKELEYLIIWIQKRLLKIRSNSTITTNKNKDLLK